MFGRRIGRDVGLWHVSTVFECPPFGRCWGQTGHRDRAKMERMTHSGHWDAFVELVSDLGGGALGCTYTRAARPRLASRDDFEQQVGQFARMGDEWQVGRREFAVTPPRRPLRGFGVAVVHRILPTHTANVGTRQLLGCRVLWTY